ncbi:MAG: cytidine/deoxycytidylate deaminase family protein [Nanoarchaeota archaeon]|nr:cytidine/deoxycytidylate deaminase family protein [Nanoarchaeota archaeon]MBU1321204.1 cytidine/deoxycytidylate deaminase family protein [Nanoarchaeota archaeon]MBU1597009.1 cytidine/deoxycytidylate deaminase family protein [Nanoarchaeota archaeon]MBU2441845.1 cytidine/deoxycytidylate deaminase family protein [Nanoarchaeota archaeon]
MSGEKIKDSEEQVKKGNTEKEKYIRPTWDEYFMEVSRTIAKRATCDRGRSGCVIAKNKQLLVTGYVGSPIGMPHCDDVGHLMKKVIHDDDSISQHCVRTVHAEQNAICQAAKLGVPIEGATLYCKMTPCRVCAMLIINSGIKRVVCEKKYHKAEETEKMFLKAGTELDYFDESIEKYENM